MQLRTGGFGGAETEKIYFGNPRMKNLALIWQVEYNEY